MPRGNGWSVSPRSRRSTDVAACRFGGCPTELFADARSDLLGTVTWKDFHIANAGFAEGFFLDRVPGCRGPLIMLLALIFHGYNRPATLIDNKDVDPLAVDRAKPIIVNDRAKTVHPPRRCENFSKAGLREDAISSARCRYVGFDDLKSLIFRCVKQSSSFERSRHHGVQLLPDIFQVGGQIFFKAEGSAVKTSRPLIGRRLSEDRKREISEDDPGNDDCNQPESVYVISERRPPA
jgi:hypothetical protein